MEEFLSFLIPNVRNLTSFSEQVTLVPPVLLVSSLVELQPGWFTLGLLAVLLSVNDSTGTWKVD